jgi:integrase
MKNTGEKTRLQEPVPDNGLVAAPKRKKYKRTELEEFMYLQPEEIRALFDCIESRRDRAIFRVVYHHGLRAHEVGLLEMSSYRDLDGLLYIRRGKGSISRQHRLIPEELKAIRAYIKFERGTMPGPLFPSRQGRQGISRFRLDQLMKAYCHAAGIRKEKAHMHALRCSRSSAVLSMTFTFPPIRRAVRES